jgi:hypothetical protein
MHDDGVLVLPSKKSRCVPACLCMNRTESMIHPSAFCLSSEFFPFIPLMVLARGWLPPLLAVNQYTVKNNINNSLVAPLARLPQKTSNTTSTKNYHY